MSTKNEAVPLENPCCRGKSIRAQTSDTVSLELYKNGEFYPVTDEDCQPDLNNMYCGHCGQKLAFERSSRGTYKLIKDPIF